MKEFFNSSEEIVQRSESKRNENAVHMQPEQKTVDRALDRHAQLGAQQQFDRPSNRPTGTSPIFVGVRPTDRPKKRSVDRSG